MKRAFTITEVIVLAAIITILAAVLFPVLSSQPTSIAACLSNQNQLLTGVQLYAADYNDHVVPYLMCDSRPGTPASSYCPGANIGFDVDRTWTARLKNYVSSPL